MCWVIQCVQIITTVNMLCLKIVEHNRKIFIDINTLLRKFIIFTFLEINVDDRFNPLSGISVSFKEIQDMTISGDSKL